MKIGILAEATGTPVETIRFYEREGLLPPPARAENNYRMYLPVHVERLAFVRQCRNLDMTLDEIRALLALRESPTQDCGDINTLLDEHIGHVAQRIRELRALEADLKALRTQTGVQLVQLVDGDGVEGPYYIRRPFAQGDIFNQLKT